MRGLTTTTLGGLISLASSQLIDLDYVESVPDPTYTIIPNQRAQVVTYNQDPAIASDVAEALHFLADGNLASQALNARTPDGYTRTYQNLKSCVQANGYMGYTIMSSYNVQEYADRCSRTIGCQGFNTYFERSPNKVPGPAYFNPEGAANPFCVLWGGPITPENACNEGQWREQYHVVITASNGYVLTSSLNPLSNKAINAPIDCNNDDSYMGMRLVNDNAPFDPQRCEAICEATSQYNIDHLGDDPSKPPRLCKFYITYILNRNSYSQAYAVNNGQWRGDDHYTISSSVFFHNATDVTTPVCPAHIDRLSSTITSYTSTTTIEACGASTAPAKLDGESGAILEAVVAVYPEKVDNATVTGSAPAMVTIPAEQLDAPGVYASASSAAIAQLTGSDSDSTTPVSPTCSSAVISSACSRIISTVTPTVTVRAQATETTYNNCAQYPTTCQNGSLPRIIAGSFSSSSQSIDDGYFTVDLPFQICIYGTFSTRVNPSSNGLITLGDYGVADFFNYNIPNYMSGAVLMAIWDDLFIARGKQHCMDYSLCGDAGHCTVTFDWRVTYCCDSTGNAIYIFSATFFENHPGRVRLNYFGTPDQGFTSGRQTFYKYSYDQPSVNSGLKLIFDPAANYFGEARTSP
ncbi:hypothetical protein COCVIDRAFT_38548 [Bipolaris victoriae FI3]|uniref:Uncharacterized protein n=1 Tax=Bipolaris victoriae (strain FI3) TaxID=930091 RepID=W7E6M8_BIPV3|nr:hypothetical protein COCVIDRAFT_38548 [Bipolaris victoriae FI3]